MREGATATRTPAPCGFYNAPVKECSCSAMAIARYQKKISGPLLDRNDLSNFLQQVVMFPYNEERGAFFLHWQSLCNSATICTEHS